MKNINLSQADLEHPWMWFSHLLKPNSSFEMLVESETSVLLDPILVAWACLLKTQDFVITSSGKVFEPVHVDESYYGSDDDINDLGHTLREVGEIELLYIIPISDEMVKYKGVRLGFHTGPHTFSLNLQGFEQCK